MPSADQVHFAATKAFESIFAYAPISSLAYRLRR